MLRVCQMSRSSGGLEKACVKKVSAHLSPPPFASAVAIYRMGNRPGAKIQGKWERKWKMAPGLTWPPKFSPDFCARPVSHAVDTQTQPLFKLADTLYEVRPENPAEYSHDYMRQAQWIERLGLTQLLRIPGACALLHDLLVSLSLYCRCA